MSKYFENTNSFNSKNFFYFTEISAKRTEYLKNFDSICHIIFIKSIINEYNINKIIYYNVSDEIITTINSFSNIKFEILKKYKNVQYQKHKIFLRQVNFALKILFLKYLIITIFLHIQKILIMNIKLNMENIIKKILFLFYPY